MTTSTNTLLLHHPFPAFGTEAHAVLYGGGLVLLPTANLWQVVARSDNHGAVRRALRLCPPSQLQQAELVFPDVEMLNEWCPRIDPALDRILTYHQQPVTLSVKAGPKVPLALVDDLGEVKVRLAMDSQCYRLCEDLGAPLVACMAMGPGCQTLPISYGSIRSDVLCGVDHIVCRRQQDVIGPQATVVVRMGPGEQLQFLR